MELTHIQKYDTTIAKEVEYNCTIVNVKLY